MKAFYTFHFAIGCADATIIESFETDEQALERAFDYFNQGYELTDLEKTTFKNGKVYKNEHFPIWRAPLK